MLEEVCVFALIIFCELRRCSAIASYCYLWHQLHFDTILFPESRAEKNQIYWLNSIPECYKPWELLNDLFVREQGKTGAASLKEQPREMILDISEYSPAAWSCLKASHHQKDNIWENTQFWMHPGLTESLLCL